MSTIDELKQALLAREVRARDTVEARKRWQVAEAELEAAIDAENNADADVDLFLTRLQEELVGQ